MKKIACLLYMISFLSPNMSLGQAYNFLNFDIADGLVHSRVTDICEDQFGNLWLATSGGGLSKFNGLKFENYTIKDGLASNYVRSVINDARGNIWAATAEGISKLDGTTIKNFRIDSIDGSSNSVTILHEDSEGKIWFSAPAGGLGAIDTSDNVALKEMTGLISSDRIIDIEEDSHGNIWLVSAIQGLFKYDGNKAVKVIKNATYRGYLLSIEKDDDGMFWIGTSKGLLLFDPSASSKEPKLVVENIFIKSAEVITSENIWMVSSSGALQLENGEVKQIGLEQGLTDKSINSIYVDREGNTWFASDGEGLFKLTNKTFEFVGKEQGLTNLPTTTITQDSSGVYWFGSFGNGIANWDGESFTYYNQDQGGLPSNYITSSATDQRGNIWFGTRGSGLIKYDGNVFDVVDDTDGLVHNIIRKLFVDSSGQLWVGTISGLSIYDGKGFQNYNQKTGLANNIIWHISESKTGEVLVVTRDGFSEFKDGELQLLDIPQEIFAKRINTAVRDNEGNLWIGYSGHGIIKLGVDNSQTAYSTDTGLGSDLIYSIEFDSEQNIIVGTERGIYKIYQNGHKGLEARIKKYQQVEGFANLQTTNSAVFATNDDILYGNNDGVYIYHLHNERINNTEPKVYIYDIKLFYNEVDWRAYSESLTMWTNIPAFLELSYNENNLVINFFATSMTNPEGVKYKYRLIGLDEKWSSNTERTEAVYTNLEPGRYKFEVIAANSDNIWSQVPTTYNFRIIPPFWQTWWFYLLAFALILISLKTFNDYRIRVNLNRILQVEKIRSEEQKKARKVMARDFHDNLGNQLASISVYVNLINLKLKKRTDEIDDLLSNIQKYTNGLFTGTKDFIWSMDPDSDELSEVYTYIKDFGEELFEKTPVDFYSSADNLEGKTIPLSLGWSRQLVLIFKEAMTNALKHSNASEVHLKLSISSEAFVFQLSDNGVGFNQDEEGRGIGFKSMNNRAATLGGKIQFLPNENDGAKVVLTVPLPSTTKDFKT